MRTLVFLLALVACGSMRSAPKHPPPSIGPTMYEGPPVGATITESGLAFVVLQPGGGVEHPGPRSAVTVHYAGWTADGTMFDSSYSRGVPATFGLHQVIPGWSEAVQLMVVGEKTRFWIPPELAYGYGSVGPTGQLMFEIELLAFEN